MLIKPLAASLLLAVFLPLSLGATTFTVTKTEDDNGSCTPEDCALREAIIAANETPGKDLIMVPGGTYPLTIAGSEDRAMAGDLDILEDADIVGKGMATILGDGADGSDGLMDVFSSTVSIFGLTLENGSTFGIGGAIRVSLGRVDLVNSAIVNNRAKIDGGGLYLEGSSATLVNCLLAGNEAVRNGGGVRRLGLTPAPATLTLVNTTVSGNSAATGGGSSAKTMGSSSSAIPPSPTTTPPSPTASSSSRRSAANGPIASSPTTVAVSPFPGSAPRAAATSKAPAPPAFSKTPPTA